MNRIYRLVWNTTLNLWTVVAENAKGRGKGGASRSGLVVGSAGSSGFALLVALAFLAPQAQAADAANASVVAGAGHVSTIGNTTTITQSSQRLAIDWLNLSTAAGEALIFNQPNAQAIALNRITGSSPSELLGSLTANGQVFILNPNGVLFGAGSQVNVGGLVASTLNISNADFMAGNNVLTGNGGGSVVNRGTLTAAPGGYLALLAPEVRNEGVMMASLGTALLAAGNKVTLNLDNGSLLGYSIDQGAINALAENRQLIRADGGQVLLSATAADALTTAAVNNTGVIEARTLQNKAGRIMLMGDMETGTTNVGGTLDASAPDGGNGGFIETSAAHVKVAEGAQVTTKAQIGSGGTSGTWLIDPHDFTIAATGGDISGATLSSNLANGNVQILSSNGSNASGSGDININDTVGWSANTLTLTAARDVNINAVMSATGSAGLSMNTGTTNGADAGVAGGRVNVALTGNGFRGRVDFSGSGTLKMNGDVYTVIQDVNGLQAMANNLSGKYVLGSNIDASATSSWDGGKGFVPIGSQSGDFTGRFDGLGHTISNLFINRTIASGARLGDVGLFGYTRGVSSIRNVGMVGTSINGYYNVGALVGMHFGSISNSYATGVVGGTNSVGGLVGINFNGSIANSYSMVTVNGTATSIGGLVGATVGSSSITNSYASGGVTGERNVGGLVGSHDSGTISNSYATGTVMGSIYGAGGLVGINAGTIINSYATGAVTGSVAVGGLVGSNTGAVNNSFWNTQTSGQTGSAGGTGVTTAQMQQASTFAGWNMATQGGSSSVWRIYDGSTTPLLRSFLTSLTLADTTTTYNGATQTGVGAVPAGVLGTAASGKNAGTYHNAYYSTQQGYDIIGGALTINKATVTIGGVVADNKTYDGSTSATLSNIGTLSGLVSGESLTLSQNGSVTFADKNAGTGKTVTAIGYSLADGAGGLASNYQLASTNATTTADIGKATVTVTGAVANNKTYDGSTAATLSNIGTLSGLVGGESLTLSQNGTVTFADKNAGIGKTVTANGYSIANGAGGLASNYQLVSTTTTTTGDITPKALTYTVTAADKTYDGTTTASATLHNLAGFIGSEMVTVSSTASSFNSKDVASANLVTVNSATLADGSNGGLASNYTIVAGGTAAASINKATVTIGGAVANNKTYDGTTSATLSNIGTLSGLVSGESLILSQNGTVAFADKNAGTGKTVTAIGYSLADGAGGLASNYQLASTTTTTTADIGKATVTVTGAVADSKTYDGTTAATLSNIGTLSGLVSGETLVLSQNGSVTFADKNAGTGKTVTATGYTIGDGNGGLASNYQLASTTAIGTGNITPKALTYTVTATDKTYDGNTTANATLHNLAGFIGSETVTVSSTAATFNSKDVASANLVTVNSATLADGSNGGLAGNYTIVAGGTAAASINKATVTIGGAVANNKTYDGSTSATLSNIGTLSGLVSGESLTLNQTGATFNDKNAGSGKTVTVTGYSLADGAGGLASNYQLASTTTTTIADIGKATVTVTGAVADSKTYDGTTAATLSNIGTLSGLVGGETLTLSQNGTVAFGDKNAGSGKTVTATGYSLTDGAGGLASNYQLASTTATTTADIGKATVTVTGAVADNKTYDGTTSATLSNIGTLSGLVSGETLTLSQNGSVTFADKNAGTSKTVTATGYNLADGAGGLASNYQLASTVTTTADIGKLAITVEANTTNKSYDGTTASNTALTSSGILTGDTINFSGNALFADKNVGTGKAVNITGIHASGADAGNYSFNSSASTTANIHKANLTVTANNDSRLATGAAYSGGNGVTYSGFVAGETPDELTGSLTYGGSAQGASTVGTYTITAGGLDASNYALNFVDGILTISYGSAAATAVGNLALVAGYDAALKSVNDLSSSLDGNDSSVDAMADALVAAAAEAGNDDDK